MTPTTGSVLHFAPDNTGWEATLKTDDGTITTLPVIGWATVVTWVAEAGSGNREYESGIEPVILVDSRNPIPLSELLTDWSPKHTLVELVQPDVVRS